MRARRDIARSSRRQTEFVVRWHEGVFCGFGPYPPTCAMERRPAGIGDLNPDHERPVELFKGLPKRIAYAFRGGA
jgi:hypothetical protein